MYVFIMYVAAQDPEFTISSKAKTSSSNKYISYSLKSHGRNQKRNRSQLHNENCHGILRKNATKHKHILYRASW